MRAVNLPTKAVCVTQSTVFILSMLLAYLAGSINFAILLFRLSGQQDPRTGHSGNPGVTNVFRLAGWPMAALVLFLDVGRAAAVALTVLYFLPAQLVPWAGFGLIMGNHFPCFHGFKGGKGVANYLGFCVVLVPVAAAIAVTAYLIVFAIVRVPFVASFAMISVLSVAGLMRWGDSFVGAAAVVIIPAVIVWFHRANIGRLIEDRKKG